MADHDATHAIDIVGMVGGEVFGAAARAAIDHAQVLVGSPRHLCRLADEGSPARHRELIELTGPLDPLLDTVTHHHRAGRRVCVLASGDPGFFGIARMVTERVGPAGVLIWPAPSSVSLAWAAAGLAWEDADVVSAHGRCVDDAARRASRSAKVAVLTAPASPPETIGAALVASGCGPRDVVVVSRIGEPDASVTRTDLAGLVAGRFDPMSVVLLVAPTGRDRSAGPTLSWGRSETAFAQRNGMITKSEVRSVVLGKLDLPHTGVLWDVGAGSGSVGIEAATIAPGLRVVAVERSNDDAANIHANAGAAGVAANVDVTVGSAPDVLADLPAPDRVFVGGGGLDVVAACWDALTPGGVLVATFVVLDRAVAAMQLLGSMVQLHVDRAVPIGDAGMRLAPTNPTFVCWGRR